MDGLLGMLTQLMSIMMDGWYVVSSIVIHLVFQDIIGVTYFGPQVGWFPNNNGTFGSFINIVSEGLSLPTHVGFADINNDGFADFAAPQLGDDNRIYWWLNNNGSSNFNLLLNLIFQISYLGHT